VLPPPGQTPAFTPQSSQRVRRSAARRLEATVVSYAIVIATAAAVVYYFIDRG
jgi:hypothetical protein